MDQEQLMKEAVQRLGQRLIRLTPAPLRPLLARLHRPLARYVAAAKYRRKYSGRFASRIDEEDDLMQYGLDLASAYPAFRYYHAVRMYLGGGEWNAHDVERVLDEVGLSLREAGSLLEFACGYGRLTRHFVHRISPAKITVSDVDPRAVDFVVKELGVKGFYSAIMAEELIHHERYDVIVVVSLFSHLSIRDWGPWLKQLSRMLNPDGLLLFSTHNFDDADEKDFQVQAEGFLYREQNETRGRLNVEHYGAAYVSKRYVDGVIAENFSGRLLKFVPHALMGGQDAYVLQREVS